MFLITRAKVRKKTGCWAGRVELFFVGSFSVGNALGEFFPAFYTPFPAFPRFPNGIKENGASFKLLLYSDMAHLL